MSIRKIRTALKTDESTAETMSRQLAMRNIGEVAGMAIMIRGVIRVITREEPLGTH